MVSRLPSWTNPCPLLRVGFPTLLLLVLLTQSGCIQALVMANRIVFGDPKQKSAFEVATGVNLKEKNKRVMLHCSARSFISEEHGTLTVDLQEELIRRMKRRGLSVHSPDSAARVLDRHGGKFDPKVLAREIDDVDYIMHVEFATFSYMEPASPNLYRGNASGRVYGYEVRGDGADRHTVKVFDQEFKTTYPSTHPVPFDQTPKNVFIRRFVNNLSDTLGMSFYEVRNSELFEYEM